RPALVGAGQRVDEHVQQGVLRQTLLLGEHADCFAHVEIAHDCSFTDVRAGLTDVAFLRPPDFPGLGCGPHTNTVRARSIESNGTTRSTGSPPSSTRMVAVVSSAATSTP